VVRAASITLSVVEPLGSSAARTNASAHDSTATSGSRAEPERDPHASEKHAPEVIEPLAARSVHQARPQDARIEAARAHEPLLLQLRSDVRTSRGDVRLQWRQLVEQVGAASMVVHRERARQHDAPHARSLHRGDQLARRVDRVALLLRRVVAHRRGAVDHAVMAREPLRKPLRATKVGVHDRDIAPEVPRGAPRHRSDRMPARARGLDDRAAQEA
jgi:hypothetical protein